MTNQTAGIVSMLATATRAATTIPVSTLPMEPPTAPRADSGSRAALAAAWGAFAPAEPGGRSGRRGGGRRRKLAVRTKSVGLDDAHLALDGAHR